MEVLYAHCNSRNCTKITKHPHLFFYSVLILLSNLRITISPLSSLCSWSSVLPYHPNSVPSASVCNGDENRGLWWCRKWESPGYVQSGSVYVFLYDLGGNVERIFMQLESGIKLGGAASPRENRIQSGLDVLEKQIAWKLSLFSWSQVQGFIHLRPGWERFHRKHRDCIWHRMNVTPVLCPCKAGKCPVGMYELWQFSVLGGVIQLYFVLLRAQQQNLGCFDTNFMRMGWLERVQSELTEIIPDLEVRKLQRRIEGGHTREEGRKHQSLQVWKGRLPRPELQQVRSWLEIQKPADKKGFPTCSACSHLSKNGWKTTAWTPLCTFFSFACAGSMKHEVRNVALTNPGVSIAAFMTQLAQEWDKTDQNTE